MRVFLIGATGNLGSRTIPALLAHGHSVVAYVRSPEKLRGQVTEAILARITVEQGDGLDEAAVADVLRRHASTAIVFAVKGREPFEKAHTQGNLVAAVTSAAVIVGRERRAQKQTPRGNAEAMAEGPIRAWVIGALGSLVYPGTEGQQIQDYLPGFITAHHRETEDVIKTLATEDLAWSLLCVFRMYAESVERRDLLATGSRQHQLQVGTRMPPRWQDHWIRHVPWLGSYLNLVPTMMSYYAKYEDVADLLAEDLERGLHSELIGQFVGYKAAVAEVAEEAA